MEGLAGRRGGYNWFGDRVVSYMPSIYDDQLRGTDALLMFYEEIETPEGIRNKGYPLAVDLTTDTEMMETKISRDIIRIRPHGLAMKPEPSFAYWVDLTAQDPGDSFVSPGEGKVETVNASLYIPRDFVAKFRDSSMPLEEVEKMMDTLGHFVTRQLKAELEVQALILLKQIDPDTYRSDPNRHIWSRDDLRKVLADRDYLPPTPDPGLRFAWSLMAKILPAVTEACAEQEEKTRESVKKHPMLKFELEDLEKRLPPLVAIAEKELFAAPAGKNEAPGR